MKYKLATTCFVIGSVLASVAAYAADSDTDRSKPVTFVKDSVITTKIKTKLTAEHLGSAKHIKVDTDRNGVVWLSGTANSQEEADKAVEIAPQYRGCQIGQQQTQSPQRPLTVGCDLSRMPGRFDTTCASGISVLPWG
jgi:hyperosmotically inducible protein